MGGENTHVDMITLAFTCSVANRKQKSLGNLHRLHTPTLLSLTHLTEYLPIFSYQKLLHDFVN